jgi:TolB-like protein/Tfp pilus assembly protein PilF
MHDPFGKRPQPLASAQRSNRMNESLSSNTTISHYRIVSKLGAGGMGEVWLAEDTRLDRKVALKLLPAEFTQDADRVRRFIQEAKAASALNHPNIITVYDIGESEAGRFIVMELVAGRTLRGVIARDNSLETLLTLGSQMARALSAAHAAGITHRDIKPDNIMVRDDGYVKVLDFGLARLLPTASGEDAATLAQQTTPGMIMGTVAYMSPEQACGQNARPPSDIFALGIVLYELMTGQHPFGAETLVGYLHAITLQTPQPPSRLRRGIPVALDELILRMLKKDAGQRPTASEVAEALQELERRGETTRLPQIESETILLPTARAEATSADEGFWVAVLPFKSRGANADLEALAEGLTEDIVTGLSRFSYLRVIARSSTLRYASDSSDARSIGKEVGARYVIEGNLRQAGSMMRVAVQLVDAQTGAHLWAETYDRPYSAEQIFALQDDLVPRIVSTVADAYGILPHSMSQAVRRKAIDQLTAYEALLRSFSYVERVTAEEHAEAKAALERAVEQAPGDSDCWAMLSILHTDEHIHGFSARAGLLDQALQLARRAVDANPLNHRAYQALAWALCYRKEFDACRHAAERTVALNSMDASAMAYVGQTIAYGGGWERGCELLDRAMQLNPHHPGWYRYAPFLNAYRQGDYRGALDIALKMNMPGVSLMYVALAAVYGQLGELEAAREAVRELLSLRPDFKTTARTELEKLWDSELVDRLIEGLRKAGMESFADEGRTEPLSTRYASGEKRADEGFWVAVLPFKVLGSSTELETMASGMSEEIITGLSRFSYLRVIARGSTLKYSNESGDIRAVGKELGARYVMEGSLRQAGSTVRLAVQLVDATTGAHLWAETFDRHFQPDQIFAMQDELIPRIVSTCADHFGVLARSISDAVRWKDSGQLSPYEALMRGFGYHHRLSPSEHAEAREVLERAVEQAPGNADCWAMLSWIYSHEHGHSFNTQPDSLDRALAAARRAIDLAPSNHLAYQALAVALFFRKDKSGCLSAAERAMALNPLDASNEAIFLITFTGDWDRGCALINRAMELNPHHPGWYRWVLAVNEYRKANYREAVDLAVKANVPEIFWTNMLLAAAYGQLGELETARDAVHNLLAQKEDFVESARGTLGKWYEAELVEHLVEGLRKAGLEVDASLANSGGVRADEGFWVAVLPFKYRGGDANIEALAEDLSEDIVTGLSRFSYLRVIARSSTLRYSSESGDIHAVGKALGARYVMEGSLRQAGSVLRITVQLVDASTGAHLWAETYNRTFSPEAAFELQDDLVPRIVSTVADWYGVLPHSMSEAVRLKPSDQLSPYEAVLRSFGYYERITPEEHAPVRAGLERAVEQSPGNADGWAMLSMMYGEEHRFGFNAQPDPLGRSLQAARRAVDAAHANHFAWLAVAQALFFRKESDAFRDAAERAIALNPMDGSTIEYLGHLIAFSGDWERGCELAERARQLNPNHPAWYWAVPFLDAYRKGDYRSARTFLLKGHQQGHFFVQALIAAVQGQLGEREAADKVLREVLAQKPDFPLTARDDFGKWYLPELVEQLIDGLRKAGLEIADEERATAPLPVTDDELSLPRKPQQMMSDKLQFVVATEQDAVMQASDKLKFVGPFPSIAVLPFDNISNDPDNEYFCDGLAEELLNALSKIEALRVAARTSAFSFKGKETDIREIGHKLNVSTVLEGSVRKAGNRLRITAQLVNIADGYHLWSERYDREMKDIFDVQDEITLTVVDALKMKLLGEQKAAVLKHYTDNTEAYQLYLKGRYHANRFTREGFNRAIEYLNEAIEKDPHYALAYAGIADAYYHAATIHMPPGQAFLEVKAASTKALELDDGLAEAHTLFAMFVAHYDRKPLEAESGFRRGIELAPNNVLTHQQYGLYLAMMGRFEEAIAELKRAQELDPLSLIISFLLGWTYYFARQPERAKEEARKALEIDESFWMAHWTMALGYEQTGQYDEALTALEKAKALDDSSWIPAVFARVYAGLGRKDEAQKILDELTERSKQRWVAPYLVATAYVSLDRRNEALEWLQKALEDYDEWMDCINVDPALDPLRSDRRFQDLVGHVGLPQ